ncbi:DNA-binding transcriptional repressor DeoR, partial [Pseudomonas syringae]|nr:DNA-binding transcriptional repressor DeoR [Pseudomonas syringae]
GAVRTAHFGALSDFHCVVSDKKIPRSYREAIEASGAQLLL